MEKLSYCIKEQSSHSCSANCLNILAGSGLAFELVFVETKSCISTNILTGFNTWYYTSVKPNYEGQSITLDRLGFYPSCGLVMVARTNMNKIQLGKHISQSTRVKPNVPVANNDVLMVVNLNTI